LTPLNCKASKKNSRKSFIGGICRLSKKTFEKMKRKCKQEGKADNYWIDNFRKRRKMKIVVI